MGKRDFGIDLDIINSITSQIATAHNSGTKLSIVGGEIFLEVFQLHPKVWIGHPQTIQE